MLKSFKIGLMVLVLGGVIALGFMSARRAAKGSNDFDTFYDAGQSVLQGKGIYYTGEYYQGDKTHAPFLYPPFAAVIFAPLALMPIKPAAFFWNFLCVGFFAGSFVLCGRLLPGSYQRQAFNIEKPGFNYWAAALFLLALLVDNLTMAQVNLLVLLLVLLALRLVLKKNDFSGGNLMAAAVAVKVTPLIFVPYFLLKRQWKVLAGSVAGAVVFFVLVPTIVFGWNQNIQLHRQWLGKTFKPALIGFYSRLRPEAPHPFKKSVAEWRTADLYNLLTPKNQSLSAVVTRWCLKDRNALAYSLPIYVAQRYLKLPVLGGGLPYEALKIALSVLQAGLLLFMFALFVRRGSVFGEIQVFELGLIFLSMTLFSPLARSHQFIFWMLPIFVMAHAGKFPVLVRYVKILHAVLYAGIGLYALQACPYGKAAGMGMWANLVLWIGLMGVLLRRQPEARSF